MVVSRWKEGKVDCVLYVSQAVTTTLELWIRYICGNEVRDEGVLRSVVLLDRRGDSALELVRSEAMALVLYLDRPRASGGGGSSSVRDVCDVRGDTMMIIAVC